MLYVRNFHALLGNGLPVDKDSSHQLVGFDVTLLLELLFVVFFVLSQSLL